MKRLVLLLVGVLVWPQFLLAADLLMLSDENIGRRLTVAAGRQLVIDTSGLTWPVESPELIVLQRFSDYYSLPYRSDTRRYVLNVASLKSHDAPPFDGLREGDAVYLLLGREPQAGALQRGMFVADATWYLSVREQKE